VWCHPLGSGIVIGMTLGMVPGGGELEMAMEMYVGKV
jgi:hypothetical protein